LPKPSGDPVQNPAREGLHIEDVKNVNGEWVVTGTSGVVLTSAVWDRR
jgi:hypothetical protein